MLPEDAPLQYVHDFVVDSVSWAGGCKDPMDPLYNSLSVIKSKAKLVKPTEPIIPLEFTTSGNVHN